VGLDGLVDVAGGVFGLSAFVVVEGFRMVVEVFFGPGRLEVALTGPLDAVPAVAGSGGDFGHGGNLAYHEPLRADARAALRRSGDQA
jgi:hypothetical protein